MDCAGIVIRPARREDIPRMAELLAELFALESDFAPDRNKQIDGLSRLCGDATGSSCALVAEHNGEVIGMASIQTLFSTAEGGRVGLVEDVIVDQDHRGAGIGSLLLERLLAWSRAKGLRRLQLLADRENLPAIDFYVKHGWNGTGLACLRKLL